MRHVNEGDWFFQQKTLSQRQVQSAAKAATEIVTENMMTRNFQKLKKREMKTDNLLLATRRVKN